MEDSRLERLEKEISELKSKMSGDKPKKEKKPRAPSEYNTFLKNHIAEQKSKLGDKYDHRAVFKSASEAWLKKKQSS